MAMSTRLRAKMREENVEAVKMIGGKNAASKQLTESKDTRKAFGDINNRIGNGTATVTTQKTISAFYKDVKPRVDSRWKKTEPTKPLTKSASLQTVAVSKPVIPMKQSSKPSLLVETISMQVRRTTKLPVFGDTKKDSRGASGELQLIKSPFKLRKEKTEQLQKNFYESHSSKLIHQVEDIDINDVDNPQMLSEYVNDIYAYLFKLEKMFPIRENFLSTQMDVTPRMRTVLLDWLNEVHNQFSLELETYHMAVSMIDRYLQSNTTTPRRYLQLVGVTALFMASKYEELMPPEITDFVYVTDDTYSKEQILQMEKKIFETLRFNLSKPLPIHFLRRFTKAAGKLGDRQYVSAKYLMELASIDYELTKYKPSQIAAASLYLSIYALNTIKNNDDLWTPTLEYYSTYSTNDLMPIMKRLAVVVTTAKDAKLKSVFTKYSHANYKFISTIPEMTGLKMQEIAKQD